MGLPHAVEARLGLGNNAARKDSSSLISEDQCPVGGLTGSGLAVLSGLYSTETASWRSETEKTIRPIYECEQNRERDGPPDA